MYRDRPHLLQIAAPVPDIDRPAVGSRRCNRIPAGHLGKIPPLLQIAHGLLGFCRAGGADMGQAQHPIPLVRCKILTHFVHGEIYIREDGPHGVFIDQFLAPFPLPLTHELHGLI